MKPKDPIEKRVFKNTFVGIFSLVLSLLQAVVSVPILLNFWGNETYGLWLSLFAGFTLLQTIDLGHQNYIGNKLNLLYHVDKEEFKKVLGSSLIIAYLIGTLQLLIALYIIIGELVNDFLGAKISPVETEQVEGALISLVIMWFLFGSAGGLVVRILIPAGMMYESQWLGILMRMSQFVVLVLVAITGGKILSAGLFIAVVQAVVSVYIFFYVKGRLPEFFPWWQISELKTAFNNFKYSLVLTGNAIGQQLANNGIVLFIANFFQSSVVPVFTTLRTITNTAANVSGIFIQALLPDVVKFHAKGEKEKLLLTLDSNWFISGLIVNTGIVIILPFVKGIYIFWTNGQLEFNFILFLCLASGISFLNFGYGLITYLAGVNDLKSQIVITITRTSVIFIASYLLIDRIGLLSIGVGIVLSEITASVFLSLYFVKLQLKRMNISFNFLSVFLALIPPIIVLIDTIILSSIKIDIVVVSIISLLFILIVYYFSWKNLDIEVKERIQYIFKNPLLLKRISE